MAIFAISTSTVPLFILLLLSPIIYRLVRAVRDPLRDIPGPALARYSRLWYTRAINKGDFEETNIKLHRKHGPIVRLAPNMYSISSPAAASIIYNSHRVFPKSRWYFVFQQPEEPNIFSTNNDAYAAEVRRKYQPAYNAVYTYEYAVDDCSGLLERKLTELSKAGSDKPIDLGWWITCFAFDVNGEIAFSKRFGHLDEGKDIGNIAAALAERLDYCAYVGNYPSLHPILWQVIKLLTYVLKQIDYTLVFTQECIDKHQASLLEKGTPPGPPDMLTRFLTMHNADPGWFTKNDLLLGAYTSIVAGADTTWISLGSVMHYLHKHPETLRKLRAEIDGAAEKSEISDPVTFAEAKKLPYLNAVIKEAQRMHSPTGLPLWRVVPEGGAELLGRRFPEGTTVGVNTWVSHRDLDVYGDDADVFRPDRWLEAGKEQLISMERNHMPFGMGPRICQGQVVALMEMAKVIPQLIRRFDFEMVGEWETMNHWFVAHKGLTAKVKVRTDM